MTEFEPFDGEYQIDKNILTEDLPPYLDQSIRSWLDGVFLNHALLARGRNGLTVLNGNAFLHPLQETFRCQFQEDPRGFSNEMFSDVKLFRNLLSYILQNVADVNEARKLEVILERSSSAYAVDFIRGEEMKGLLNVDGSPMFKHAGCKLIYRVPKVVRRQAENAFNSEPLLAEAWDAYYRITPDDEKSVVRATDALSGAIRDKYFLNEKRPVFGTMIDKITKDPAKYPLPARSIYDQKAFLSIMKDFSKIRGNHQKGTGRMPTHEEAAFVLHFSIMFYQLLRSSL